MTGSTVTVENGQDYHHSEDDLRRGDVLLLRATWSADVRLVDAAGLEVTNGNDRRNAGSKRVCDEDVFIYRGSKVTAEAAGASWSPPADTEYRRSASPGSEPRKHHPGQGPISCPTALLPLPAAVRVRQQVAPPWSVWGPGCCSSRR